MVNFRMSLALRYRILFLIVSIITIIEIFLNRNHEMLRNHNNCFQNQPTEISVIGIYLNSSYEVQKNDINCFRDQFTEIENDSFGALSKLEDILMSKDKPQPDRSIFFHETSCRKLFYPPIRLLNLTARQACAIESAALHNPNFQVFVLFASPTYTLNTTKIENRIINALLSYKNVHLNNLNLWTYASGSPLYQWLKGGEIFNSVYLNSHVSDFLRYLTLWRWSGIYLDLDTVTLTSLEDIPPNFTGAESLESLAAGVMSFSSEELGRYVAEKCLLTFEKHFDGNNWGANGPGVITRVMQSICSTDNVQQMFNPKYCRGFRVFENKTFYAVPWRQWKRFFQTKYLTETLKRLNESFVAHVWNKHSFNYKLKLNSNVAYIKLAAKHCPRVYGACEEYF